MVTGVKDAKRYDVCIPKPCITYRESLAYAEAVHEIRIKEEITAFNKTNTKVTKASYL